MTAIMAEAKAALNLLSLAREMHACYLRGHRFTSKPTENHT